MSTLRIAVMLAGTTTAALSPVWLMLIIIAVTTAAAIGLYELGMK